VEPDPKGGPSRDAADAVKSLHEDWPELQKRMKDLAAGGNMDSLLGSLGAAKEGAGKQVGAGKHSGKRGGGPGKRDGAGSGRRGPPRPRPRPDEDDPNSNHAFHYFQDYLDHHLDYSGALTTLLRCPPLLSSPPLALSAPLLSSCPLPLSPALLRPSAPLL
jgi:hypothetical protein